MSLKEFLKDKLLSQVLAKVNPPGRWKILVVDSLALFLLDSTCKMSEILNQNVTVVEGLLNKRQPYPDKDAIYLISPSLNSVQALINDFSNRPVYRAAHVFCLSALPDSLFDRIKNSKAKQYLKTFIELNIDFTAPEPNYFSLESPESWFSLYNSDAPSLLTYELSKMSRKIVSVLANLGENPYIRYHTKPQAFQTSPQKSLSGELAHLVQSELDQMIKDNKEFVASENRATLIILDRRIDCLAPLLHEISYQCMLADLGGLNNGKYKDEENNKEHVLDETDLFWAQVRTWHISEVMEFVTDKFNKFKEENKAAQWELEGKNQSGSSESKIQALKDVMSSFGDYQTTKEAVSRHMSICLFLSKVFADRLLEEVVDLEQSLVMTDPTDGSFAKLLAKVDKILQNPNIEQLDKFRVVLLAVIAHDGISDAERQRFLQNGRFRMEESQALTNMGMLGVRLSPSMGRKNEVKNPYSLEANVKKSVGKQHKFENAKYTPTINYIAKDQIKSNLDPNWFPYVRDIPSASKPAGSKSALPGSAPTAPVQRKKATWAQKKTSAPTPMEAAAQAAPQDLTENGPRTIIFIIGGSTYSEIKTLTDLRQEMNREIILGSTHVWTPDSFVESLKDLHRPNASAKFIGYKRPPLPQRYERGDASLSRNGRGMDVPVSRSSRGNDSIARSPRGSTRSYDDDRGQRPSRGSPPPPERMRGSPPSERSRSRRSESRGDSSQSRSDGRYDDPRRREPVVDDAEYRNSRRTREGRSPPPRQRQQYNSLNESMSRVSVSDRDERQRPRSAPKETVKEEPPKKKGWFGFSKS